ncbi:MAG: DUF4363 family protein [Oscillospiraceae bacterium]
MKRIYAAIVLLGMLAVTITLAHLSIEKSCDSLCEILRNSCELVEKSEFVDAKKKLEIFKEDFKRSRMLFLAFVNRDIVNAVELTSSSLDSYATIDTKIDFLADTAKTINQIDEIKKAAHRLF